MNKLYVACAMLVPLVGCGGTSSENSNAFSGSDTGVLDAGGSAGTGLGAGSSGNVNAGSGASSGSAANSGSGANANANAGASGAVGSGSSANLGSGGGKPVGPGSASGGSPGGATCPTAELPVAIQTMITNRCSTCHGSTPSPGLPSLGTFANLTAPARSDPSKTYAIVALARIQAAAMPMPPAPGARASASEVKALQDFIAQGYPKPNCGNGSGGAGGAGSMGAAGTSAGGGASGGGPSTDPLFAMPICSSKSIWQGGNEGSASMNPGMACDACHRSSDEAPIFSVAGTVYPTGHEPDRCNSSVGTAGAKIVIIGADGKTVTLTPNGVGSFSSNTVIKPPFQAKVTYQGRERLMLTPQTSGDCNSCHTQSGNNAAPGRITVP